MSVLRQSWTMSAVYLTIFATELTSNWTAENLTSISPWTGVFTILGYLTSSILMDKIGRRSSYILGVAPGAIAYLLLLFEDTEFIGKALNNLSFGASSILGIVIIGEYTSPKYRAIFLNSTTAFMYLAQLTKEILSMHFASSIIVSLSFMLKMLALAITFTWPESPFWLVLKGRFAESEASFDWIRGNGVDAKKEKKYLITRATDKPKSLMEKCIESCKICMSEEFRRPVTVVIFGSILGEAAGRHYLPAMSSHFTAAIGTVTASKLCLTIIIAISSVSACILLAIFRQRQLLLVTGLFSITGMFAGSVCTFAFKSDIVSRSWINGVTCLVSPFVFSNLGVTSIPIVLIGEVFTLEHKAIGSFVSGVLTSSISWLTLKVASNLLYSLHVYGTLMVFLVLIAICLLFLFVIIPETKGRTLMEIEEFYKYGWFREDGFDEEVQLTQP